MEESKINLCEMISIGVSIIEFPVVCIRELIYAHDVSIFEMIYSLVGPSYLYGYQIYSLQGGGSFALFLSFIQVPKSKS